MKGCCKLAMGCLDMNIVDQMQLENLFAEIICDTGEKAKPRVYGNAQ